MRNIINGSQAAHCQWIRVILAVFCQCFHAKQFEDSCVSLPMVEFVFHCQWFHAKHFEDPSISTFKDPSLSCRLLSRLFEFEIDEAALSVDEDDKRRAKGRANKESYGRAKGRANISPEYII
ncbi:hypothetical protein Rs2_46150 [Raphanus sativus]|nr:hypothetical protein Rs2_46150 [Raphanus sativus]